MRLHLGAVALVALVAVAAAGTANATSSAVQTGQTAMATSLVYACALDKNGSMRWISDPALCRKKETAVTISPGPTHVCYQADGSTRKVAGPAACPVPGTYLSLPPLNVPEYFCAGLDNRLRHVSGSGNCGADTELIVNQTNHAPTDIALSSASVAENQPSATTVGTFTTTDPEPADTHTYTLVSGTGSGDNGSFTIAGNALKTAASFNFEAKSSYSIRVRTTDPGGLFFEEAFTISVTDVNEAPVASSNTYSAIGNTELRAAGHAGNASAVAKTTDATNVLTNDSDPDTNPAFNQLSAVAASGTTLKGGTFTIAANGSFVYDPPAGVTSDTDSFTFTLTDGTNNVTETVNVTLANRVWYVDNALVPAGTGTSISPLNSIAPLTTGGSLDATDGANDYIFLFQGSGNYTGGLVLESGQRLYGQPHGLTVGVLLISPGGSNPTIANAAGDGVTLSTGNDVQGISLGSATGAALKGSSVATATVDNVTTGTIAAGSGNAVDVNGGTLTASFTSVSGTALILKNLAGSFTGSAGTLSGSAGAEVDLDGGAIGVTYAGAISSTAGRVVSILNKTGGIVALSGAITDNGGTGTGVFLNNNSGATINLTGGSLALATGANPAFTATGGGTVTVTGSTNTLSTTTGTALNVQNTTIGAADLNFKSIASNGAPNGIVLNNTGSTGGLNVTGDGSANSGGTITASTGAGISLTGVGGGVSLTRVNVTSGGDDGIRATTVSGFAIASSTVSGNGNANGERGLDGDNVTGTGTITSTTFTGSATDNARIDNDQGTLNLTVTSSTFSSNSTSLGSDGLLLFGDGTATMTSSVTGSTFSANRDDGFQLATSGATTASMNLIFNTNTVTGGNAGAVSGQAGVTISTGSTSTTKLSMSGNSISGSLGSALILNPIVGATFDATVENTTIGTGAAGSGSADAHGIWAKPQGNSNSRIALRNNTIRNYEVSGMYLRINDGGGTADYTVTGNTVSTPNPGFEGVFVEAGATNTDTVQLCADIGGAGALENTFVGAGGSGLMDVVFARYNSSQLRLPGYGGGTLANLTTFIQGRNVGSPTVGSYGPLLPTGGAACALPALPPSP